MAFVISEGQVRSLAKPLTMPTTTLRLADDFTADYAEIWRTQQAVRTVVSFLGRNIASLGLHVYRRVSDTDRARVTDHPIARLIRKPNQRTTYFRLMDGIVHDLGIYDCAYLLKIAGTEGTQGLVRLPPRMVKPVGDSWLWPEAFEIKGQKGSREVSAADVVHFHGYDPAGGPGGSSPIEALRRVLAEEYEAGRMREQSLRNGARMSGYLKRPASTQAWSDSARQRFVRSWRSQYSGSGPQAGGTPILEDGMEFIAAGQTSEQLQYIESRKLTREEVAASYFIPPTMVGVMDSATFSNIREQHKHLYQDTLGPWLTMIVEELALQLLDDFDDTDGLYLEFNLAEKLRGSFEEQAAQLQTSVGGPYLTRNEARARNNLPAIEGADELIVPLNVITGGQASPTDSAPAAGALAGRAPVSKGAPTRRTKESPEADENQREEGVKLFERFFERQSRAVLSAIGAGADWWDAERWDTELAADLLALALDVSGQLGPAQAEALGFDPGEYDVERTVAFLEAVAASRAAMVNKATRDKLDEVLAYEGEDEDAPTPESVFEEAKATRSISAGGALVTTVAAFALVEAAHQLAADRAVKTWRVTSGNPRAEHAAMDGETVGIDDTFSNGMNWPGDPAGGVDEVAGCMCTVDVTVS